MLPLLPILLACAAPSTENAVLITVDTLRADHVGAYGGPVPTPHLDALAADGVVVEHAFTPMPSTGPALTSLFSGSHPWRHGVLRNAMPPPSIDLPNLPRELQRAGFATGAFVSSYVVSARFGFDRGFDRYHFEPTVGAGDGGAKGPGAWWSRAEPVTAAALDWLDSGIGEPFFLWVHYMDPHDPYRPPAGYERPENEPVDVSNKRRPPKLKDMDHLRRLIRYYRGSVVYTDEQLGRLVTGLRDRGLLDRTAIVVTADHGEGLGDHGLLGHGRNLHDELVQVPLIVRAPGIAPRRRSDGAAQLEDLLPTVLSLLGVPIPESLDGLDLVPWLRGETSRSPREAVIGRRAAFEDEPALFYERRGPRKWIGELDGRGQLHKLEEDPLELAGLPARGLPTALREQGAALRNQGARRTLDEETRAALTALGYLE